MAKLYLKEFPTPEVEISLAKPDWECAPVSHCRDSGSLECANFDELEEQLDHIDPYGDTWEVVYFKHFSCGWMANIFVKPGSKCAEKCDEVRIKMAIYPCLNEDKWVEYEAEDSNHSRPLNESKDNNGNYCRVDDTYV